MTTSHTRDLPRQCDCADRGRTPASREHDHIRSPVRRDSERQRDVFHRFQRPATRHGVACRSRSALSHECLRRRGDAAGPAARTESSVRNSHAMERPEQPRLVCLRLRRIRRSAGCGPHGSPGGLARLHRDDGPPSVAETSLNRRCLSMCEIVRFRTGPYGASEE